MRQGKIGSSLAAEVEIHAGGEDFALLDSLGDDMRLIVVTSEAHVVRSEDAARGRDLRNAMRSSQMRALLALSSGCGRSMPITRRYAVDAYPTFWFRGGSATCLRTRCVMWGSGYDETSGQPDPGIGRAGAGYRDQALGGIRLASRSADSADGIFQSGADL